VEGSKGMGETRICLRLLMDLGHERFRGNGETQRVSMRLIES
jgi:hypothetical protein